MLKYVFPFDESISFHRICGYLLFICSFGHTACHIGNYIAWVGVLQQRRIAAVMLWTLLQSLALAVVAWAQSRCSIGTLV